MKGAIAKITVAADDEAKVCNVHKDLLSHYSTYFRRAFNSKFVEATTLEFTFDDVSPQTFDAFVSWLYFGRLYEPKVDFSMDPNSHKLDARTTVDLTPKALIKIWLLGDRLGVAEMQNSAIDELHLYIGQTWWNISSKLVPLIYRNTLRGSKLRAFLILDFYTTNNVDKLVSRTDLHETEFLIELAQHLHETRDAGFPKNARRYWKEIDLCEYHIHFGTNCEGRDV